QLTAAGVNGSVATPNGTGRTISQGTLTISSNGNFVALGGTRILENASTANFNTNTASMTISGGASMINDAGKTWNLTGATINSGAGGGTFTNQGTLNASGANTVAVLFNNTNDSVTASSGTVNVTSGKLAITGGGTGTGGATG